MGVYDRQRATATRLIAKYGERCTWTNTTGVKTDDNTPWLGGEIVKADHSVNIAFFTSNSQIEHLIQAMAGTSIPHGETIGYMATVSFSPSIADVVTRSNGEQYRVKSIDPLRPNGEATILYTLEFEQ